MLLRGQASWVWFSEVNLSLKVLIALHSSYTGDINITGSGTKRIRSGKWFKERKEETKEY